MNLLELFDVKYSRKHETSILFNSNTNVIHYELNIIGTELSKMYIYLDCFVMFDNDIDNYN